MPVRCIPGYPVSQNDLQTLLERLIFRGDAADERIQDIWDLNGGLGEEAASLLHLFREAVSRLPDETAQRWQVELEERYAEELSQLAD